MSNKAVKFNGKLQSQIERVKLNESNRSVGTKMDVLLSPFGWPWVKLDVSKVSKTVRRRRSQLSINAQDFSLK